MWFLLANQRNCSKTLKLDATRPLSLSPFLFPASGNLTDKQALLGWQHCRLSIFSYFGWLWQILKRGGDSHHFWSVLWHKTIWIQFSRLALDWYVSLFFASETKLWRKCRSSCRLLTKSNAISCRSEEAEMAAKNSNRRNQGIAGGKNPV